MMLGVDHLQTIYITGLGEGVEETLLHAAFIPFGEICDIIIPPASGKSGAPRFALVQYGCKEDALAAIDNMHRSELGGRPIRVSLSNPAMIKQITTNLLSSSSALKPVWEDNTWLYNNATKEKEDALNK